jgi:O-methyltransferase
MSLKHKTSLLGNIFKNIKNLTLDLNKYYLLPKKDITYAQDQLYTFNNADFMKDPKFLKSYNLGKKTETGNLLKDNDIHWRIHVLCWAASYAKHLPGDFVDCGVNTGIFARAVANYIDFQKLSKKYYLLDTFSGMDPKFSSKDEMARSRILGYGQNKNLYHKVKKMFSKYNVRIIKGSVPKSLSQVKTKSVCFLSIDMNSVKPEVSALNYFWPKMVKGGIIILDDYGYPGCLNQKRAHDAFAKSKNVEILSLPTCQGLIIKS